MLSGMLGFILQACVTLLIALYFTSVCSPKHLLPWDMLRSGRGHQTDLLNSQLSALQFNGPISVSGLLEALSLLYSVLGLWLDFLYLIKHVPVHAELWNLSVHLAQRLRCASVRPKCTDTEIIPHPEVSGTACEPVVTDSPSNESLQEDKNGAE